MNIYIYIYIYDIDIDIVLCHVCDVGSTRGCDARSDARASTRATCVQWRKINRTCRLLVRFELGHSIANNSMITSRAADAAGAPQEESEGIISTIESTIHESLSAYSRLVQLRSKVRSYKHMCMCVYIHIYVHVYIHVIHLYT